MFKPEYRVQTYRSTEEFETALRTELNEGWQLHSFCPGAVQMIIAVYWTVPPPFVVASVPAQTLSPGQELKMGPLVAGKS